MFRASVSALALLCSGGVASHAEPLAPTWTGLYTGLGLGAGQLNMGTASTISSARTSSSTDPAFGTSSTFGSTSTVSGGSRDSQWGGLGSLYIGHNTQWNNLVFGIQADVTLGRINTPLNQVFNQRSSQTFASSLNGVPAAPNVTNSASLFTANNTAQLNWMASVLGRAGYLVNNSNLVYALGGLSYAGFETDLPFGQTLNALVDPGFAARGVTVGAGFERRLDPSWSLKAEYRYTKFQDVTLSGVQSNPSSSVFNTQSGASTSTQAAKTAFSTELHTIQVGLSYYFNSGLVPNSSPSASSSFAAMPPAYAGWDGSYAGFALGGGGLRTRTSTVGTSASAGSFANTVTGQTSSNNSRTLGTLKSDDKKYGEMADFYVGYNKQVSSWVVGLQAEGTLSRFDSALNSTGAATTVNSAAGVSPAFSSASTSTLAGTQANVLQLQWMASILARAGYLVSPRDLVYGLAGYTYGRFETDGSLDPSFSANGVTAGIGWERKLDQAWSFRAEGRYTKFGEVTLNSPSSNQRTSTTATTNSSSVFSTNLATTVANDLFSVRVGLARSFDPAAAGSAMAAMREPVYKALPYPQSWSGLYAGFGLRAARLNTGTATTLSDPFTDTVNDPAAGTSTLTTGTFGWSTTSRDRKTGGFADVFVGYNRQWQNLVLGVQAEATLGRVNIGLHQTGSSRSTQTRTNFLNGVPQGTPAVSTDISNFIQTNTEQLNWMVSILGRAGYAVDDRNLLYVLGGWTYAGFEADVVNALAPPGFGANGVTVGAGVERKLDPSWGLKLEYRYTKFQDVTLAASNSNSSTSVSGTSVTNRADTFTTATRLSNDLHSVQVGLSHYFNAVPPYVSARASYKAPPNAYGGWTGFYGGFALGVGGLGTRTSTAGTSTDIFTNTDTTTVPPTVSVSTNSSADSATSNDRKYGGMADLFAGYNRQVANWVVGVQSEGTLSRFNSRVSSAGVFTSSSSQTGTPPFTSTATGAFTQENLLQLQWMASILARAGYLVTGRDLVYGLLGWTYGRFETDLGTDPGFGSHGISAGLGWERKVDPDWSFRVEGRYTRFSDATVNSAIRSVSSSSDNAGQTSSDVSTRDTRTNLSNSLLAVRVGIARQFSPY